MATRTPREASEDSVERSRRIPANADRGALPRGTAVISTPVSLSTYTTPRRRRRKHAPRSRRPRRLGLFDFQLLARVGRIRANRVGRARAGHEQLRDGVDARGLGGSPPPGERVEARLRPTQALVRSQGRELFRGRRLGRVGHRRGGRRRRQRHVNARRRRLNATAPSTASTPVTGRASTDARRNVSARLSAASNGTSAPRRLSSRS